MMKKETSTVVMLIIIVMVIILLINYIKANGNSDEKTMRCIAENSKVIVSPTCSACAYQKQILKEHLENYEEHFEIIDVAENPEILEQYDVKGVPTWVINENTYPGVRSIEQLEELTEC